MLFFLLIFAFFYYEAAATQYPNNYYGQQFGNPPQRQRYQQPGTQRNTNTVPEYTQNPFQYGPPQQRGGHYQQPFGQYQPYETPQINRQPKGKYDSEEEEDDYEESYEAALAKERRQQQSHSKPSYKPQATSTRPSSKPIRVDPKPTRVEVLPQQAQRKPKEQPIRYQEPPSRQPKQQYTMEDDDRKIQIDFHGKERKKTDFGDRSTLCKFSVSRSSLTEKDKNFIIKNGLEYEYKKQKVYDIVTELGLIAKTGVVVCVSFMNTGLPFLQNQAAKKVFSKAYGPTDLYKDFKKFFIKQTKDKLHYGKRQIRTAAHGRNISKEDAKRINAEYKNYWKILHDDDSSEVFEYLDDDRCGFYVIMFEYVDLKVNPAEIVCCRTTMTIPGGNTKTKDLHFWKNHIREMMHKHSINIQGTAVIDNLNRAYKETLAYLHDDDSSEVEEY